LVNLAGEPIAEKRWTPVALPPGDDSRVQTTRCLVEAMALQQQKTCLLVKRLRGGVMAQPEPTASLEPARSRDDSWSALQPVERAPA